jgi:hypothetical protein
MPHPTCATVSFRYAHEQHLKQLSHFIKPGFILDELPDCMLRGGFAGGVSAQLFWSPVITSEPRITFLSDGQDVERLPRNFLQTKSNYADG